MRPARIARYQLTIADYHNTYYGRLAERMLQKQGASLGAEPPRVCASRGAARRRGRRIFRRPKTTIRTLLALGLYEPAVKELEFARAKWGDSPGITATIAWANKQMAASESGTRQFTLARGSITLMKRAYPQFMASGGEQLPREILTTIFPLEYWDLIKKYSAQNNLDPYLVAALMAQESTFVRDIKSHAGAYGLMQMMPPTGRQYARKLKLRYSLRLLTTPETEHPDGHDVLRRQDPRVRRRAPGAGELQRRRDAGAPLDAREPGPAAGRVHRRHSVPGNAAVREAAARDGRGLPPAVRRELEPSDLRCRLSGSIISGQ